MEQKRLLLAFLLSGAILFGWVYFVDRHVPQQNNANLPLQTANNTPFPSPPTVSAPVPITSNITQTTDNIPRRSVTIKTPLYEVKLDSQGAVATSWIINQNKDTGHQLYSVAGDKNHRQPLELIPSEKVRSQAHDAPLSLSIGDAAIDSLLSSKNYNINNLEGASDDIHFDLKPHEKKSLSFVMHDDGMGLDVVKDMVFDAENYTIDLGVKLTRSGQPQPNVKLSIGPNVGDQGVPHYNFYSVAPEGIFAANDSAQRFTGKAVHEIKDAKDGKSSPDHQVVAGPINWAGIGDTYFAMVAVPPQPSNALEFQTVKIDYQLDGKKEDRFLITGRLAIPADGSPTRIYVGPKDHYLLTEASANIGQAVGHSVDLEGLIDYGWLGWLSRSLARPILRSIKFLGNLTGSYGVAIILFTIVIYSLFFPLKWRSSKSMKKAQKLAPRMKELQEKIKGMKQNDPRLKELQMEQLRLMKEGNPLGGCLPLLIQMPFLFALYRAITISIDFRQATFLWLPDLSAADPYRLLPILMAGSMVILQFITPAPSADPLQRKMMAIVLPAFMLYMLWSAPAGLLVYWLVGNIVGFSQQMIINRLVKSEDDAEPPQQKKTQTPPSKKFGAARVSQV